MPFTLKKMVFVLFFALGLASPAGVSGAGNDILPERSTTLDKTVIVNTTTTEPEKTTVYNDLKRWVLEENVDPVNRALEVYKKKSESTYNRRIWLTDRGDGKKRLVAEFASRGTGDKLIFSPNEDFMYYLGVGPGGGNLIYGIDLLSNRKFTLGSGDDFRTVNCPDKKSFMVVQQQNNGRTIYQVYSTTGERMKSLTNIQSPVDIEKSLCR